LWKILFSWLIFYNKITNTICWWLVTDYIKYIREKKTKKFILKLIKKILWPTNHNSIIFLLYQNKRGVYSHFERRENNFLIGFIQYFICKRREEERKKRNLSSSTPLSLISTPIYGSHLLKLRDCVSVQ
jgi:hypothetical protein